MNCITCNKELKKNQFKYCSRSCAATNNNKLFPKRINNTIMGKEMTFICLNCKKEHTTKNKYSCSGKFCSTKCSSEYFRNNKIEDWLEGKIILTDRTIKKYLIEIRGYKCEICNISKWMNKEIVFELEHIDGNSNNNSLDNLLLLCPNCHSQTKTYKGKNKGNGRKSRMIRYYKEKLY